MMELVSEERGKRMWSNGDLMIEQRAEVRGQFSDVVGLEAFEELYLNIRELIEHETYEKLLAWLEANPNCEAIPSTLSGPSWEPFLTEWSSDLLDSDGTPLAYFEPFTTLRCMYEVAYWPMRPVEPGQEPPTQEGQSDAA